MPINKTVLVTGGYTGIGLEVSSNFAKAGATVIISGRNEEDGLLEAEKLLQLGFKCSFFKTDIRSEEQVKELINKIEKNYGSLDYAFNNAGIGGGSLIWEQNEEEFLDIFDTNTKGLWLCLKHQLRLMIKKNIKGSIVNNLSVHAQKIIFPGVAAYAASKHAGLALTKAAAIEAADKGIRINAVSPGPIDTAMYRNSIKKIGNEDTWPQLIPSGRVGSTREVSDVVMWLCSDAASFVNGEVINISGGFSAK
ncbi:SDR family NAD(P)-dependent oxidoreductase [Halomonas dongshanensis]|uniref:SDR family oxidoreductase n=1 Tax=Halomonas dongshanensis TaxID=2890835 RepID=A0ABT2EA85_9GAMM|nr:SDR family oxidoreductase [Halomonas dongshanensis]MCS2608488.1 SDR family oxidoreductase [Halomonas dongshanensis]